MSLGQPQDMSLLWAGEAIYKKQNCTTLSTINAKFVAIKYIYVNKVLVVFLIKLTPIDLRSKLIF